MEPKREEVVEGGQAAAMAAPRARRPSQGKQRIQIRLIDNKDHRQVTFSKRRKGLFKKASELAQLCGARVAVVVFSPSERSKAFAIGAPSVDAVLRAYVPGNGGEGAWLLQDADDAACRAAVEVALRRADETKARVVAEKARMDAVGEKVSRATPGGRFWWEADVDQLGEPELTEFARALQRLRDNVQRHTDQFGTAAAPPLRLQ